MSRPCIRGCPRRAFRTIARCLLCVEYDNQSRKLGWWNHHPKFLVQVEKTETCWYWRGALTSAGYGLYRTPTGQTFMAHRASYEHYRRPIGNGMQIDHLCRRRNCVNPQHLEEVTQKENLRRRDAKSKHHSEHH